MHKTEFKFGFRFLALISLALFSLTTTLFAPAACAEPLNCTKKQSGFIMKTVCSNEAITTDHYYMERLLKEAQRNYYLDGLLEEAQKKSPDNISPENEQIEWSKKRDQCQDEGCIRALYTERIDELTNYIEGKPKVPYLDNLKKNNNPGICTDCEPEALPEIFRALKGRIDITGDKEFCESMLSARYSYPNIDYRSSLDIQIPRGEVSDGTYLIDIDNDGTKERVVQVKLFDGGGLGCEQEYQQVVDDDVTKIPDSHINKSLLPDICPYVSKPFIYHDKVYIENRVTHLSSTEIGVNWRNFGYASLLSDIFMVNGSKLQQLCHYEYKHAEDLI